MQLALCPQGKGTTAGLWVRGGAISAAAWETVTLTDGDRGTDRFPPPGGCQERGGAGHANDLGGTVHANSLGGACKCPGGAGRRKTRGRVPSLGKPRAARARAGSPVSPLPAWAPEQRMEQGRTGRTRGQRGSERGAIVPDARREPGKGWVPGRRGPRGPSRPQACSSPRASGVRPLRLARGGWPWCSGTRRVPKGAAPVGDLATSRAWG